MQISVVIPTCNRKSRLCQLLGNLNQSIHPIAEVIVVDSGDDRMTPAEYLKFSNLKIIYLNSERSVCVQRNKGIKAASSPWIFLCDDDNEVPADYLYKLANHIEIHPDTGAVSGITLEQQQGEWKAAYDINSSKELFFKYIFQLSIWGNIVCKQNNFLIRSIKNYYSGKGNHISKAGWPVVTDFSGDFFITPIYGLATCLIRKTWLEFSPYDEVLDQHGIGDNYGVAIGFPKIGIHVLNHAFIYHHHEQVNRLQKPLQTYRRALALDYFIKTKKSIPHVKKQWLLWSLLGNTLISILQRDKLGISPSFRAFLSVLSGRNPYYENARNNQL
jgi:glycosyltransferase involved in cell wall biosynthesis